MSNDTALLAAAVNALKVIDAIYEWVDRVNKAGGTTTITGVAEAHAMLASLNKNRPRVESLIAAPIRQLVRAHAARPEIVQDDS